MRDIMTAIGVILTSVIVLAIPILFVCSIYENWPGCFKLLLFCLMAGDILAVSCGVMAVMEEIDV